MLIMKTIKKIFRFLWLVLQFCAATNSMHARMFCQSVFGQKNKTTLNEQKAKLYKLEAIEAQQAAQQAIFAKKPFESHS